MSDKRVPLGDLSAYERWELPSLGEGASRPKQSSFGSPKREQAKLPTAAEIEQIRQNAKDDGFLEGKKEGFTQGFEKGLEDGRNKGLEDGRAEGLAQGQTQIAEQVARLQELMQSLLDPIKTQESMVSEAMLNVSLAIARSVIHRELSQDSSVVSQLVTEVISSLPSASQGLCIEVNPSDHEVVSTTLEKLGSSARIEPNERVHPGGCLVQTSTQQIDYTVEKRFQSVVQEMLLNVTDQKAGRSVQESAKTVQEHTEYDRETLDQAAREAGHREGEKLAPETPTPDARGLKKSVQEKSSPKTEDEGDSE